MFDLIITGYRAFFLFLADLIGLGWAIVALSFICSFLMMPLMKAVAGVVKRETEYQNVILPQIAAIKEKFASDIDRNLHIQSLYSRYSYSPISAVKKVLPLFVQIPFLLLTYFMLKGTAQLSGVAFGLLTNLGEPDHLLSSFTFVSNLHLLPLVMTGVNIVTVFGSPGFTKKDMTQAIGIALLFLVMLYTAPSALLLYWTLNNVITMVRTLCEKHGEGVALLLHRVKLLPKMLLGFILPVEGQSYTYLVVCSLRNFIVLILFAVLPIGWVLLSWVPDRVAIEVAASEPGGIVLVANERDVASMELRPSNSFESMAMYLPEGCAYGDVSFRLSGDVKDVRFGKVTLRKFWLLDCVRNAPAVEKRSDCDFRYTIKSDRFDSVRFIHPLLGVLAVGGLLILLILSCIAAKYEEKNMLSSFVKPAVYAALVLSFVFLVDLPLQSFLINRQLLNVETMPLLRQIGMRFAAGGVLISICLVMLGRYFGKWIYVFMLSLAACVYLESGLLSIGLPELTGNMDFFDDWNRALWDAGIWALVFVIAIVFRNFVLHRIGWISLIIITLAAESLLEVKVDKPVDALFRIVNNFSRPKDVVNSIRYSQDGNILLIVLDSLTRDEANAAINDAVDGEELKSHFAGFTAFTNNVGMHAFTAPSVAGILTGEYFENPNRNAEYFSSIFSTNSVLKNLLDAQWSVYMLPGSFTYGYTNRPDIQRDCANNQLVSPMKKRIDDLQSWNLEEFVKFRSAPFALKRPFYNIAMRNWPVGGSIRFESVLFPMLSSKPIMESAAKTFMYVHTEGVHVPVMYDRNGHLLPERLDSFEGGKEQAIFILRELGRLMDAYREMGIYDKSLIIVSADHGDWYSEFPKEKDVLPNRAKPMLWIKPVHSNGAFANSPTPTSQSKLASVIRSGIIKPSSINNIGRMLKSDFRRFRVDGSGVWQDWDVDGSNHVWYAEHEQRIELRPLICGKAYTWNRSCPGCEPDIKIENAHMSFDGPCFGADEVMSFKFKVSDISKNYSLLLSFFIISGDRYGTATYGVGGEKFYQPDNADSIVIAPHDKKVKIEIPNLRPTADGFITVCCEKCGHSDALGFTGFQLEQMK